MALFGRREKVFEVQGDAARWKAAKRALKACGHPDHGVRLLRHGAAGLRLRRQAGPPGTSAPTVPIDRHTYYLSVPSGGGRRGPGKAAWRICKERTGERPFASFPAFALFLETVHAAWNGERHAAHR